MYLICDGLARLLAPILPVTADDLWRHLPGPRSASVHLEEFPEAARWADDAVLGTWERLLEVRETVNAALEAEAEGQGHRQLARRPRHRSRRGDRSARCSSSTASSCRCCSSCRTSTLHVGSAEGADEVQVEVEKAPGVKCERCWRFVPTVRTEPDWAGICDRCVDALGGSREPVDGRSRGASQLELWIAGCSRGRSIRWPRRSSAARFELHDSIAVIPGFFDLTRVHNTVRRSDC